MLTPNHQQEERIYQKRRREQLLQQRRYEEQMYQDKEYGGRNRAKGQRTERACDDRHGARDYGRDGRPAIGYDVDCDDRYGNDGYHEEQRRSSRRRIGWY